MLGNVVLFHLTAESIQYTHVLFYLIFQYQTGVQMI